MDRRQWLTLLAGTVGTLGGCSGLPIVASGPDPTVVDHFRGAVTVTNTERVFDLGGGSDEIRATVENTGYDATVELSLYWVPQVDSDPDGRTHDQLLAAGYDHVTTEQFDLSSGETVTHRFEVTFPTDSAGYYVRKRNLTYGGVVENRGDAGPVTVTLLDTSDRDDTRLLQTRAITMAADERRDVVFETDERFEVFRVEASAGHDS